ncbi:MAG: hypothetical protein R2838_16080 [Caldilineaceae bacterium]
MQEYLPAVYSQCAAGQALPAGEGDAEPEAYHRRPGRGRVHGGPAPSHDGQRSTAATAGAGNRRSGVGVIVLDVVLGYGAHPDPRRSLRRALPRPSPRPTPQARPDRRRRGRGYGRRSQDMDRQIAQLAAAGCAVYVNHDEAVRTVGTRDCAAASTAYGSGVELRRCAAARAAGRTPRRWPPSTWGWSPSPPAEAQVPGVVQVDWRPPAGGNERLAGILAAWGAAKQTTKDSEDGRQHRSSQHRCDQPHDGRARCSWVWAPPGRDPRHAREPAAPQDRPSRGSACPIRCAAIINAHL